MRALVTLVMLLTCRFDTYDLCNLFVYEGLEYACQEVAKSMARTGSQAFVRNIAV